MRNNRYFYDFPGIYFLSILLSNHCSTGTYVSLYR